ncbi:MAG: Gfo/Idh/MocA family oxidoreductase [Planctomycetia bacterium]|nr:Gfo/Idh/MocA family oxidoreductase [Planctomycetia bacterium]
MTLNVSRRNFLKTGAVAGMAVGGLSVSRFAHANGGSDVLKVGLVGCGGRGKGAAYNALDADPNTKIVALADIFPERVKSCREEMVKNKGDRAPLTEDSCFVGFDAYKNVIEMSDVVILCSTPYYRPIHLKATVEAGKHCFFEKPVATDPAGIRTVLELEKIAKEKNLTMICGLCWRYDFSVKETMKRVLDGEIGDVLSVHVTYLTGRLWEKPRQEGDTEMIYQNRNWYNFRWLSGDHNVEQAVHSIDKGIWAFNDVPPINAWSVGARTVRNNPKTGDIFDQISTTYDFGKGRKLVASSRQINGCHSEVCDYIMGTKGYAQVLNARALYDLDGNEIWKYRTRKPCNMYVEEHKEMFKSIRSGAGKNDMVVGANSTMMGIIGREAAYTGKLISWKQAMEAKQDFTPTEFTENGIPENVPDKDGNYRQYLPGTTKFE